MVLLRKGLLMVALGRRGKGMENKEEEAGIQGRASLGGACRPASSISLTTLAFVRGLFLTRGKFQRAGEGGHWSPPSATVSVGSTGASAATGAALPAWWW